MSTIDRSSWNIKGEAVLDELIAMMAITPQECRLMQAMQTTATQHSTAMVDTFYTRLLAHEYSREYIGVEQKERLRGTLAHWFTELFCGEYNRDYALKRLRIGVVHVRIGLPVRYPLAMMDIILQYGEQITAMQGEQHEAALKAFRKILSLDIALFNQAYEDEQLDSLAKMVGGERLARRLLSAGA